MDDLFDRLIRNDEDEIERIENPDEQENDENREPDETSEETKRIVKPKHRVASKRPTLDSSRLLGPRGIDEIQNLAKDISFKGKRHEKDDLAKIITMLHYWTHRLYPKMTFEDCLEKIEILGKKRPIQTHLTKMRLGMFDDDTTTTREDDIVTTILEEPKQPTISDEQKERILKNRMMAQARRAAKLEAMRKQGSTNQEEGNAGQEHDNVNQEPNNAMPEVT